MTVRAGARTLPMAGLTAEQRTALLNHARAELLAGRPDASADAARALTVLDPMCHEGWAALAAAHRGAGRLVDARVATEMARVLEGQ
jgi:hypothetical protein